MKKNIKQRDTKQRRLVLEDVTSRCDHPTADDIYESVHEEDEKISKGTVYRNLNILSDNGDIRHIAVPGADRFDSRLDHHCHMICTVCGKVEDAPLEYMEGNDRMVEEQSGYMILRHRTIFEGICGECQKKNGGE